jgi:hypothetical protein
VKRRSMRLLVGLVMSMVIASPAAASVTIPPGNLPVPTSGTFLYLNSQSGDYVGGGVEQLYTSADSTVWASLPQDGNSFRVSFIQGDHVHDWSVDLAAALGQPLTVGSYAGAVGTGGVRPAGVPAMSVSGDGRGCGPLNGLFDVTELSRAPSGVLLAFDATFEQHCAGTAAALYGRIRFQDETAPGVTLPPGSLTIPTTGTFLYLNDPHRPEILMTPSDSTFDPWEMLVPGGDVFQAFVVQGDDVHSSDVTIAAPPGEALTPGSYVRAVRAVGRPVGSAGLSVTRDGSSCSNVVGKFDVDALSFTASGELLLFQATFEQRCFGTTEVLYGRIRIENPAPTERVTLPPGSLVVPTSGSFLYLNGDANDYVSVGIEQLYRSSDSSFRASVSAVGDEFGVDVIQGTEHSWTVTIAAARGDPLAEGSYRRASRASFRPDGSPGLEAYGDGRGCGTIIGRFDVDELAFWPDGELKTLQATFEQHCEGRSAALYGRVRVELPAFVWAVDVREEALILGKTATVHVRGTVSCTIGVPVEITGTLTQINNKGRVVSGTFSLGVDCVAPASSWSFDVVGEGGTFAAGSATAAANAGACRRFCSSASTTRAIKLNFGRS